MNEPLERPPPVKQGWGEDAGGAGPAEAEAPPPQPVARTKPKKRASKRSSKIAPIPDEQQQQMQHPTASAAASTNPPPRKRSSMPAAAPALGNAAVEGGEYPTWSGKLKSLEMMPEEGSGSGGGGEDWTMKSGDATLSILHDPAADAWRITASAPGTKKLIANQRIRSTVLVEDLDPQQPGAAQWTAIDRTTSRDSSGKRPPIRFRATFASGDSAQFRSALAAALANIDAPGSAPLAASAPRSALQSAADLPPLAAANAASKVENASSLASAPKPRESTEDPHAVAANSSSTSAGVIAEQVNGAAAPEAAASGGGGGEAAPAVGNEKGTYATDTKEQTEAAAAAAEVADKGGSFLTPEAQKACLPGCLDPARGLCHAKCPNYQSKDAVSTGFAKNASSAVAGGAANATKAPAPARNDAASPAASAASAVASAPKMVHLFEHHEHASKVSNQLQSSNPGLEDGEGGEGSGKAKVHDEEHIGKKWVVGCGVVVGIGVLTLIIVLATIFKR